LIPSFEKAFFIPNCEVAEPLNAFHPFAEGQDCHLTGCFKEIVLSQYTETELEAIDPKLIILAPFT
jgi:hypothetical protein